LYTQSWLQIYQLLMIYKDASRRETETRPRRPTNVSRPSEWPTRSRAIEPMSVLTGDWLTDWDSSVFPALISQSTACWQHSCKKPTIQTTLRTALTTVLMLDIASSHTMIRQLHQLRQPTKYSRRTSRRACEFYWRFCYSHSVCRYLILTNAYAVSTLQIK